MMRVRYFAVLLLGLSGCDDQQGVVQQTPEGRGTGLIIYTDKDNGCQYVRPAYRDGITPRLGRNGKQLCN